MKRRLLILVLLLAGIGAGLWWRGAGRAEVPGSGTPLSASALARIRVSGGGGHALVIGPDGTLWSWGDNSSALGQGNLSAPLLEPTRVGTDRDWAEIYAGYSHSFAIKQDGSLWAWGSNPAGVLGDGTNQPQSSPQQVGTDKDWKEAGPGLHHSLGLKKDGTIWAWGANQFGQLGRPELASTHEARRPVRVGTGTNWQAIAVGALHNLALKDDGTLWTWGDSGLTPVVTMHNPSNHVAPVQIGAETNWTAISAGYYHSCALRRDGTLWTWGRNSGLLGNFPAGNFTTLRRLGTNTDWAKIEAAAYHGLARREDGSLWLHGGTLDPEDYVQDAAGNWTFPTAGRVRPVRGAWHAAAGGADFSLSVARDGALWHWGKIPGAHAQKNWLTDLWQKARAYFGKARSGPSPVFRQQPEAIFRWDEPGRAAE